MNAHPIFHMIPSVSSTSCIMQGHVTDSNELCVELTSITRGPKWKCELSMHPLLMPWLTGENLEVDLLLA